MTGDPKRWHPYFPNDEESVERLETFLAEMDKMVQGMVAMDHAWGHMLEEYHKDAIGSVIDEGYPFHGSFDEVTYEAREWRDRVREKLKALIERKRGPK